MAYYNRWAVQQYTVGLCGLGVLASTTVPVWMVGARNPDCRLVDKCLGRPVATRGCLIWRV